jgi:mannose-1-phosphate guanylyltransferase
LDKVIAEPCGRNTAPAIGLACIHMRHQGAGGVVAVLPADHTIQNVAMFQMAMRRAQQAAQAGYLVTLGIEPHMPHTGYGYIKRGETTIPSENGDLPVYVVDHFREKPDLATARRFLDEGQYYWNSGIFVSRVDRLLDEFACQMPEMYARLQELEAVLGDPTKYEQALAELWPQMTDISIDYGVIEGANQVAVVPLQAGWNDVGSWDALEQVLTRDETSNILVRGDILSLESTGNVIYGDGRFMALVGVTDLVVVDTGDALLIGHKAQMQRVKQVVEHLRLRNRKELL